MTIVTFRRTSRAADQARVVHFESYPKEVRLVAVCVGYVPRNWWGAWRYDRDCQDMNAGLLLGILFLTTSVPTLHLSRQRCSSVSHSALSFSLCMHLTWRHFCPIPCSIVTLATQGASPLFVNACFHIGFFIAWRVHKVVMTWLNELNHTLCEGDLRDLQTVYAF